MCALLKKGGYESERELHRGCVAGDGEQGASESVREKDEMVGKAHELDGLEPVGIQGGEVDCGCDSGDCENKRGCR